MLLDGSTSHGPPSILDSPTLARVERAMLRQEGRRDVKLNSSFCCQAPLNGHAVKRGLLWQQRDRLFSRWKERYFILTQDYLHCFKRASTNATDRISDMGTFIFKVKLVDVDKVEWINRKSYSTIALNLGREGKVILRCTHGLEDWFELLEDCTLASKERRKALRISHDMSFHRHKTNDDVDGTFHSGLMDEWILAKNKFAGMHGESVPDISSVDLPSLRNSSTTGSTTGDEDERWASSIKNQRLSLLTDIDINIYDTPPSSIPPSLRGLRVTPTPYRLNSDVFFMPGALNSKRSSIAEETVSRSQLDSIARYSNSSSRPSFRINHRYSVPENTTSHSIRLS